MALSSLHWAPEVQVTKRLAEDAHPPLHCPTQLALSPLASQLSFLHWYMTWNGHFHLKACHFQSALFLTDSQSALALLSTAPAFPNESPSGIFRTFLTSSPPV